ncbi:LPS translocon maturation chaperone LptM [Gimibacter soli]|uniref:Lipoprotein n=1 Tax=Gimibacter soli TaxID=3024400 RepID=A0AAE9XVU2_9PROT|nr:lipoprotein [Gimibacter soli]WCL54963.1 lipoprotein [Gimibacter soli]
MIRTVTLVLAATLMLTACGKKGDLEPPTRSTQISQGR